MKDRLLYLTIGVLIGIIVFQWGSYDTRSYALSEGMHTPGVSAIAGSGIVAIHEPFVLDELGHVWRIDNNVCWQRWSMKDVPLPIDQIKLWSSDMLITHDNVGWRYMGESGWHTCGPWPDTSVPTNTDSWGGIKSNFK